MKHFTKIITLIFLVSSIQGISQTYFFSQQTDTYTELSGATDLTAGMLWDDPTVEIPLGFTFNMGTNTMNSIFIDGNAGYGGFLLSDTLSFDTNGTPLVTQVSAIMAYGGDLMDREADSGRGENSTISYLTEGVAGSQITKIEWKNAGFYEDYDSNLVMDDYINFQLWIYEGSNNVELRFGPNSISNNRWYSNEIGLYPLANVDTNLLPEKGYALDGTAESATMVETDTIVWGNFPSKIPDGAVYKFATSSPSVGIENNSLSELKIYQSQERLWITNSTPLIKIEVVDILGKTLLTKSINGQNQVDITNLPKGVYIVRAFDGKNSKSNKIIIQ